MSSPLTKAVLEVLDKGGKVTDTIPVQFNPTSLKLSMSNSTDGGQSRGRQVQQYNGSASTSLSVELEFDTADEGTTAEPVDVRTRTAGVAQFVLPGGKESKQAPPRVQFRWGTVIVAGVMTSLSEDLDLFSPQGVPLRSKVNIEIKEQDSRFEALSRGAGANQDKGAQPAGEPGAGPGAAGGPADRTAEALDGESPADFLARNGLDPAAWRAIAGVAGLLAGGGISLEAGVAVDFSASLALDAGIGIKAGFEAGLDLSLDAELGLDAPPGEDRDAGFALAAAGGVTAAGQAAASAQAQAAAGQARVAFGEAAATAGGATGTVRPPAVGTGTALVAVPAGVPVAPAASRPLPPRADPRATTFGRGVPLRDRVVPPEAEAATGGYVVIAPRAPLPSTAGAGTRAGSGCGCGGGCGA